MLISYHLFMKNIISSQFILFIFDGLFFLLPDFYVEIIDTDHYLSKSFDRQIKLLKFD